MRSTYAGFYKDLAWCAPKVFTKSLVHGYTGADLLYKILLLLFAGATSPVSSGVLNLWEGISPWWLLVPVSLLFVHALFEHVRKNLQKVEAEKAQLEKKIETEEQRTVIGNELQQLYRQGLDLRAGVMDSDDESPASEWQERFVEWRQNTFGYLHANVSVGKAEYVDGGHKCQGSYDNGDEE